jgi:hypothetical protein
MKRRPLELTVVALLFLSPTNAHAYLDPGTGSYFLQILVAGLLGAMFAVKVFWHRLKAAAGNFFRRPTPPPPSGPVPRRDE